MVLGFIAVAGASLTASVLMIQVAVLPLMVKYSKTVKRRIVFSNCFNYPRNLDYDNPSSCNIIGGRNCNIQFFSKVDKCEIKIGVWHIVPCSMFREVFFIRDYVTVDDRLHERLKKTKNTIVIYCHGNSNHRASPHRLEMYKVFQMLNMHVITFDYRGYGDSTQVKPSEKGVVEDALAVYTWLIDSLESETKPMILVWGHSLGTAIAAHMTAHMEQLCLEQGRLPLPRPDALILEAPFNNLADEISNHPFSKLISWLPYYNDTCVKPFYSSADYAFNTDKYLCLCPEVPILILHAKGDRVVPFSLAVKLYDSIVMSRNKCKGTGAPIVFHAFERGQGLGHNNLCEAPALQTLVEDFVNMIKGRRSIATSPCDEIVATGDFFPKRNYHSMMKEYSFEECRNGDFLPDKIKTLDDSPSREFLMEIFKDKELTYTK